MKADDCNGVIGITAGNGSNILWKVPVKLAKSASAQSEVFEQSCDDSIRSLRTASINIAPRWRLAGLCALPVAGMVLDSDDKKLAGGTVKGHWLLSVLSRLNAPLVAGGT